MIELGQLSASILNEERREILVFLRDGEHISSFIGNCDNIVTQNKIKVLQIRNFGIYDDIVHSIEIDDLYQKFDVISECFREIDPDNNKKYMKLCKKLHRRCLNKHNYGFYASLCSDSEIQITLCVKEKQYTLRGKKDYTMYMDDINLLIANVDSEIPFMSYVIDDTYIDFTALMKPEQARNMVGDITKSLIEKYEFKILDTYNMGDNY